LAYCPQCRREDDAGYTHCLECGSELLASAPVEGPAEEWVDMISSTYPGQAMRYRTALTRAGIDNRAEVRADGCHVLVSAGRFDAAVTALAPFGSPPHEHQKTVEEKKRYPIRTPRQFLLVMIALAGGYVLLCLFISWLRA